VEAGARRGLGAAWEKRKRIGPGAWPGGVGRERAGWAGSAGWAARRVIVARGASWAVRPGRFFFLFFILKLEIHFEASNKIGNMQIRYRWIRYEKSFNMRLNLEQKYKLYKTKI
jgi:hypothetical protein